MYEPKDEIKKRVNIVELIGEYLELKPAGTSGFKARCPFHGEKTPSFHISEDKQIWHCFGCGEGGDAFAFLMRMEGMDFPEALRHLGKKVGVEVKRYSSKEGNEKARLMQINELAAKFYEKVLVESNMGKPAREYLANRGIHLEHIQKFHLGFAPEGWETFAKFLKGRGFSDTEGIKAGVLLPSKKGRGAIDRFRGRVMVPLRDHHGNTVGFTGRVLDPEQQPKYMNSPETPVYKKSEILYGLDSAKTAIKREGRVIIVEGNLDIVSSHKAGVENIVASSGTALTKMQLELLKRFTQTIVFAFDQDAAGFEAAKRGIREARALDLDIRAIVIDPADGKDPDDVVQKNPDRWVEISKKSVPIMQYFIEQTLIGKDLANVDDKRAIGKVLLPEIAAINDVVEREHWLSQVSDLLRVDIGALRQSLGGQKIEKKDKGVKGEIEEKSAQQSIKIPEEDEINESILVLFLISDAARSAIVRDFSKDYLTSDVHKILYKEMILAYHSDKSEQPIQQSFFERLRNQLTKHEKAEILIPLLDKLSIIGETSFQKLSPQQVLEQFKQSIKRLRANELALKRKALEAEIRKAEAQSDKARVEQLIRAFNELR